jgi:hypothetical protein
MDDPALYLTGGNYSGFLLGISSPLSKSGYGHSVPFSFWLIRFLAGLLSVGILDCLLHHRHVLTIRGDSYLPREKRRSGFFRPLVWKTVF